MSTTKRYLWLTYTQSNEVFEDDNGSFSLVGWFVFSGMYLSDEEVRRYYPDRKLKKIESSVVEFDE